MPADPHDLIGGILREFQADPHRKAPFIGTENGVYDAHGNFLGHRANTDKPTRTELLAENARLTQQIYDLRHALYVACIEDENICPECGSEDVHEWRSSAAESNLGDGSGKVCGDCDHQWGES